MMPNNKFLKENYIFGLDIGTRSVVGMVGYKTAGGFNVVDQYIVEHETRSMIDGQIHDVDKVSQTIRKVKTELENRLEMPLKSVCIAAAGRVLKTKSIHVEQQIDKNIVIDDERVYTLELLGIEMAHKEVNSGLGSTDLGFHCVGYTVTTYYLNDYEIGKLQGHKGKMIGADVLATFLPNEVVESLYKVVNDSDLEVKSLTLEPIAAIDIAVPYNYRLLNIALVDIGAGTSDIAITKEGSIIAFGMIPIAGDEITESIVHKYLVDFNTAEKMKIKASGNSKKIAYQDIMGIKNSITKEEVIDATSSAVEKLASSIGAKIIELNGSHPTNAVFVVGGGGQIKGFTDLLAKHLGISEERVGLRGKTVLKNINFETAIKKSPELVTPIGICYSGIESTKHDFIEVYLNDEPVRVFNTKNLAVMDVIAFKGYNPKKLFAKTGKDLTYYFNGIKQSIKGEPAVASAILINNEAASLSSRVEMNDYISILPAKKGADGAITLKTIIDKLKPINISINKETYQIMPKLYINGEVASGIKAVNEGDRIESVNKTIQETVRELNIQMDNEPVLINDTDGDIHSSINDGDAIVIHYREGPSQSNIQEQSVSNQDKHNDDTDIIVVVNGDIITLKGKKNYVFVDIFDYIDFNLSKTQGSIVCKLNNETASYMEPIHNNDMIKVYWNIDTN